MDFVAVASIDTVERRQNLPGQADTLRTPFGEEKEGSGVAVVCVDVRGFVDGEQRDGERNGRQMLAEKSILAATFVDGNRFVGRQCGGKCGVEFSDGFGGGSAATRLG